MTKPITRIALNFKANLGKESDGRQIIRNLWAQLEGYFNIEVATKSPHYTISYNYHPKATRPSTGGKYAVDLRGQQGLRDEIIMHETFHALGHMHHSKLHPRFTVRRQSVNQGPALRIEDFMLLQSRFGSRESTAMQTTYSWDYSQEKKTYFVTRKFSDANSPEVSANTRSLSEEYLYDFLWSGTGYNILDFSKYTTRLRIDLRASETNEKGVIIGTRLFGTRTDFKNNWFGLNIINVPGVKLDEAWAGASDDLITGNQYDNKIFGKAGKDTLFGLGGRDTLDGGDNIDSVDYSKDDSEGGRKGVIVNLSTMMMSRGETSVNGGTAIDGFGAIDTLVSIEGIIGTRHGDYFFGSDQDNIFAGLAGQDTIDGQGGQDTVDYSGDHAAVGLKGIVVKLNMNSALDGFGHQDTLSAIENVIGTHFADDIIGDANANKLDGRTGNDTLDGGEGNDSLSGGFGSDIFVYGKGYGADLVTDFAATGKGHDVLSISLSLARDITDLMSKATQTILGDLKFEFGNGDTLTLRSVRKAALGVEDVRFF